MCIRDRWRIWLGTSSTSSPVVSDGIIYVCTDNRLYRIDTTKIDFNKLRQVRGPAVLRYIATDLGWIFQAGDKIRSSPALGNNILYFGDESGRLYAVDATTGKKLWDFQTGGKITSSPALVGDTLYIGCHDGKLYAIE